MPLTDRQIKNLKSSNKKQTLPDGGGLSLVVATSGGKYWQYNYRLNGKQKTLRISTYPDVPLIKAREKHKEARQMVAEGQDPAAAKQEAKQKKAAAAQNTFGRIAKEWHEYQKPGWRANHAAKVWRSFELDILPALGDLPVGSITVRQVKAVIEAVAARGALDTAATVLQRVKAVFNYAIRTDRCENNSAVPLVGLIKVPKETHQPA